MRGMAHPCEPIPGGDGWCLAIAAASLVAKVARDEIMHALDAQYPEYGFGQHKGYPTAAHFAALERLGPIPGVHRQGAARASAARKLANQRRAWLQPAQIAAD